MLGPKKVPLDLQVIITYFFTVLFYLKNYIFCTYHQEVAGTILLTVLVFGLGLGSLVGPYLVSLL